MTPTEKKLYELFSDKTLSEGCVLYHNVENEYSKFMRHWDGMYVTSGDDCWYPDNCYIIGHEPQLHDVFRKCFQEKMGIDLSEDMEGYELSIRKLQLKKTGDNSWGREGIKITYNPELPLLQQSENEYDEEGNLVKMGTKEQLISLFS